MRTFFSIVFPQNPQQVIFRTTAGSGILQRSQKFRFNVGGKNPLLQELPEEIPVNEFPFLPVRQHFISMFFENQQMGELMQKSDQKRKAIQAAIHTDPVIGMMGPVTVITETFLTKTLMLPFFREFKIP